MKVKVKTEVEVEAILLCVEAGVRYYEDGDVDGVVDEKGDLIPCKVGEMWCPIIHIDSGVITNWRQGVTASVHYKVCDAGSYYVKDEAGNVIFSSEGDYVPSILSPGGLGYGDYIIMNIDADGKIENWEASDIVDLLGDQD